MRVGVNMKKDIMQKWVSALRSGKYKQGKALLRSAQNEYCCLGVLCDLMSPDTWKRPYGSGYYYDNSISSLPSSTISWSGMTSSLGRVSSESASLAYMNDSGSTFNDIADIIEANYKEL